MLLYDKQSENDSDLKTLQNIIIFHKDVQFFTKLNIAILKA